MDAVLYLLEVEARIYCVITLGSLPLTIISIGIFFTWFDGIDITIYGEGEQDAQIIVKLDLAEFGSLIDFFLYLIHLRYLL